MALSRKIKVSKLENNWKGLFSKDYIKKNEVLITYTKNEIIFLKKPTELSVQLKEDLHIEGGGYQYCLFKSWL